jgi:hypothetical protein
VNSPKRTTLAERIVLSADVDITLAKTRKQVWRREWESSNAIFRNPMNAMVSRSSRTPAAIYRLPTVAGVFVCLPAFADFSIPMELEMELEMALDLVDLRENCVGHPARGERAQSKPSNDSSSACTEEHSGVSTPSPILLGEIRCK